MNNSNTFNKLRARFPFLVYQSYTILKVNDNFTIKFLFNLSDSYYFEPEITIPARAFYKTSSISDEELETFIFQIGMIELVSYWKCACPATVIIKPFKLSEKQILWWKNLYFNGLGEFFYLNEIETDEVSFMNIVSASDRQFSMSEIALNETIIVPIGGGKDSIVSLEILKSGKLPIVPLIVNPREATTKCAELAGFSPMDCIIIHRSIDPLLIKLNSEGFLNGHTPFSALLAFTTALAAMLTGAKHIALSNESSANEATVANTTINHQYSKSLQFECDFRNYCQQYLHHDLNYFSLLRPLNELQIGRIFSRNELYFNTFKSCNVGSKTDSWCCNCPKCLFTFLILSPFVPMQRLNQIFGQFIYDNQSLIPVLDELRGRSVTKPFECVGTVEEVEAATQQLLKNHPYLLTSKLFSQLTDIENSETGIEHLLSGFDEQHFLLPMFEKIVKDALYA
jgi:hypothetical protein